MKRTLRSALFPALCLVFFIGPGYGGIALSASAGTEWYSKTLEYTADVYYKFDEQIFLGLESGKQHNGIPIYGSIYMRLPFGNVLMPILTGAYGIVIKNDTKSYGGKVGGGFDWKNGKRSSILILGGVESVSNNAKNYLPYARIGLLLEF